MEKCMCLKCVIGRLTSRVVTSKNPIQICKGLKMSNNEIIIDNELMNEINQTICNVNKR